MADGFQLALICISNAERLLRDMNGIRLLVFDPEMIPGGVETIRISLLPALAEQCAEITWVVPNHELDRLGRLFPRPANLRLTGMLAAFPNWRGLIYSVTRRIQFKFSRRIIQQVEIALLTSRLRALVKSRGATHGLTTCIFSQSYLDLGVPTGGIVYDLNPTLPEAIRDNMVIWARRAHRVFASSEFTRSILLSRCPERRDGVLTVPMAAPARRILSRKRGSQFTLFYPAGINPHKDHYTLFRACQILIEKNCEFRLVLTGGGTERLNGAVPLENDNLERARRLVREDPRLAERVNWAGNVSEEQLAEYYASASVVVLPSRYEGFGMPFVEALQQGVPIVCSDIPPFREQEKLYAVKGAAKFFQPGDAEGLVLHLQALQENGGGVSGESAEMVADLGRWIWRDVARSITQALTAA